MRKPKLADIVTYVSHVGKKCQGYISHIKHDEGLVTVVVTLVDDQKFLPTPASVEIKSLLTIRSPEMIRFIDHGSYYESKKVMPNE